MIESRRHQLAFVLPVVLLVAAGCETRDPMELDVARAPIDPVVFEDDYNDAYFQAFADTWVEALTIDDIHAYGGNSVDGARSLKISVPPLGSALGIFSGGVLTATGNRDFADFNALTFYARANANIQLDVVGFGNDNTGTSLYEAGRTGIALTNEWIFVIVPIPAPSKLIAERGVYTFAEALEQSPPNSGVFPYPNGYDIWIDEIRFADLGNIEVNRAIMRSVTRQYFVGTTANVGETSTVFLVDGAFMPMNHSPNYFDYVSSDPSVAVIDDGRVRVIGPGTSVIRAKLESLDVQGTMTVTGAVPPTGPAPAPTHPATGVISLFSDAYRDIAVETWRANWGGSTAVLSDYVVAGDNTKMYSSLNFVGITFESSLVDASAMTHFHLDVYAPAGTNFRVKLVSFPPAGGGAGVQTGDLILDASSTPSFAPGGWSTLDIPLGSFVAPAEFDWANVGQLVLSTTDAQLALVDNVYWHD